MILMIPNRRVVVNKNIGTRRREYIRLVGEMFFLLDPTDVMSQIEEHLTSPSIDFDVEFVSAELGVNIEKDNDDCISLDGVVSVSKNSSTGSFRGSALIDRKLWLQMVDDITKTTENNLSINCFGMTGTNVEHTENYIDFNVNISVESYDLDCLRFKVKGE